MSNVDKEGERIAADPDISASKTEVDARQADEHKENLRVLETSTIGIIVGFAIVAIVLLWFFIR